MIFSRRIRAAFTLIEVMLVIAIMGIVLGVSVYQFRRGESRQDLRTAADDIKAAWAEMQVRALAGAPTPPGTHLGAIENFDFSNRPTYAYGLLLYGTQPGNQYYSSFMPDEPNILDNDPATPDAFLPGQQVVGQPFVMMGCAVRSPFRSTMRCFAPIPDYSPVLPPNTYIDKASIKVAASTTAPDGSHTFINFLQSWTDTNVTFHPQFDFERCVPGRWPRFDIYYDANGNPAIYYDSNGNPVTMGEAPDTKMARYLYLAIKPPQPTYTINGFQGCGLVRFALRSSLDAALPETQRSQLWVQFDVRSGSIVTANTEAELPNVDSWSGH